MPGPQVKDWDTYHALRRQGKSKGQAARIANAKAAVSSERKRRKTPVAKGPPDVGDVHVASVPQSRRRRRRRRKNPFDLLSPDMVAKHADHDQSTHGNWARGIRATGNWTSAEQQRMEWFNERQPTQGGLFDETPLQVASEFRINHVFPDQLQPGDVIIAGRNMRGRENTAYRYEKTVKFDPASGDRWILGSEPDRDNILRFVNDGNSTLDIIRLPEPLQTLYLKKHYGPGAHPGTGTDQTVHAPGGAGGGIDLTGGGGEGEGESAFEEGFEMTPAAPDPETPARMAEPEESFEKAVRPKSFADFVGQDSLKSQLDIQVKSAKARNDTLPHVLFTGPPGLGKTTLAGIMAEEMGTRIKVVTAPAIRNVNDLGTILVGLEENDILFIDEIHALDDSVAEVLYPAMEDFQADLKVGDQSVRVQLPQFTLIGATTRAGSLPPPLRDRFGTIGALDYYEPEDLSQIIDRTSGLLEVNMTDEARLNLAQRARGTPRIANHLTRWVRDYGIANNITEIDVPTIDRALRLRGVDSRGLTTTDRAFLDVLNDQPGPVGVNTVASFLGEDPITVEESYEPYLLREGLIARTPRGRIITEAGRTHLESIAAEFQKRVNALGDPMRCLVVNCLKDPDQHPANTSSQPKQKRRKKVAKHGGPGPHKSGTPQSIHGNWSRDTSAPDILEDTETQGGATKEIVTGNLPERGFAVALHELGQSAPIETITPRTIQTFIRTRYAQLIQPGRFIGTWLDNETGKVWLDVVQVFDNADYTMAFEQAVAFGKHENELALFDLANFEEVRLEPADIRAYGNKLKQAA